MRTGMLQATDDVEGRVAVFTFVAEGKSSPETFYVSPLFMPHFEVLLAIKTAYRVRVQDHEGVLERCTLLDTVLVCSHCGGPYTELFPFETVLTGHYCSDDCLYNARALQDALDDESL